MKQLNKNVFIVHGQSDADRDKLAEIINDLGCAPKILALEPKNGGTIIEEFESLASNCVFAFILMTPDDPMASELDEIHRYRARQNVIFEMGWFFSQLGRTRTRLLYKGEIELPTDVTGIIYIKYEDNINDIRAKIRDALCEGGVIC